jgi:phosphoribosylamine--glycine ligase
MKILVVGSGGREHALVWKLHSSPLVKKIYCAPGNAGISKLAECVEIASEELFKLTEFAQRKSIDLTVVGPELPLTLGIADEFQKRNLRILGPAKMAAMIEGSKVFAKEFMKKYHIPAASFKAFDKADEAIDFVKSSEMPLVIKADGLAAGKGVMVAEKTESAISAIQKIMIEKIFKDAGNKVVIENFLQGDEVTILAFTDGKTILSMPSSQDHKKIYDGNRGPNTGGMGAYAPASIVDDRMMKRIYEEILEPTILGLEQEGIVYKGILYAGLMLTERGPKVMEYNCRFGDPETQVILPLLKSDLAEIFMSIVEGDLSSDEAEWTDDFAVCVILASAGYPDKYEKGKEIFGLDKVEQAEDVLVFHAGTKKEGKRVLTNGGRVLGVTAVDKNAEEAILKAYASVDKIKFDGAQFRRDIGYRVRSAKREYF